MFTAPTDRPLVNLRYYTIAPRKMGEFLEVFVIRKTGDSVGETPPLSDETEI